MMGVPIDIYSEKWGKRGKIGKMSKIGYYRGCTCYKSIDAEFYADYEYHIIFAF